MVVPLTPDQVALQTRSYDALIRHLLDGAAGACSGAAQGGLGNVRQNLPVLVAALQAAIAECEAVIRLHHQFTMIIASDRPKAAESPPPSQEAVVPAAKEAHANGAAELHQEA